METHPFAALRGSFELLVEPPLPPRLDVAGLVGMPPEQIDAAALTERALGLPRERSDDLWRQLVARARGGDPAWTVIAAGLALPGLLGARAHLVRGLGDEAADVEAEMLTAFVGALRTVDLGTGAVCARLVYAARAAGQRHRYRVLSRRHRTAALPPEEAAAGAVGARGPVTVLAAAITRGVLTPLEAELIARTRLERVPLNRVAADLGLSYITARRRRSRAQQRLLGSLTEEGSLGERAGEGTAA
ncbi:hypothetical protein [Nocardiopsis composta]|uniref:Uncharacterized protein n=1 Tax=Nocardiopsis composta TaxID=157465 RepID=A0A7W8VBH9_9ACTN|nr:hypothetical protein [Nocardiopsis composta]MBB5429953.1 hypothetical protein [Nocardiopsis composta]